VAANAAHALVRFRERQKAYRVRRTRWTWAAGAASITGIGLFLLAPARAASSRAPLRRPLRRWKRRPLAPIPPPELLKSYFDELLTK
jgi:hypothetical protein